MIYYFFRTIQILMFLSSFALLLLGCSMVACTFIVPANYNTIQIWYIFGHSLLLFWISMLMKPAEIKRLHESLKEKEARANPLGLGESIDPGSYRPLKMTISGPDQNGERHTEVVELNGTDPVVIPDVFDLSGNEPIFIDTETQ